MRIIGGNSSGRRLATPSGRTTRPTPSRVREALFSILGGTCRDDIVLDLFTGTGALGLESVSRGAQHATLVDRDRRAIRACRQNVEKLGYEQRVDVLEMDAFAALAHTGGIGRKFSLIFVTPPFGDESLYGRVLARLQTSGCLGHRPMVVVQHHSDEEIADEIDELHRSDMRVYGTNTLSFYQRREEPPDACR